MTGYEIRKELGRANTGERRFIKWWRRENDFVDYELVDTFLENLVPDHEFSGFELLTAEQMWDELHRRVPKRLALDRHRGQPVIRWQRRNEDGSLQEQLVPFEAESIIQVFDEETRGDTMA